jgi:hypothetical protein
MPFFPPGTFDAGTVYAALLVDFDFDGAPTYIWNGFGPRTFDGKDYIGCGDLGTIEGLEEVRNAQSQRVTFTLSGVADSPIDLLAIALDSADIVQGRNVTVFEQLFNADWSTLGSPIALYQGIMQQPRVTREAATEDQGARRVITLGSENAFFGRSRPPAGRLTDREQQHRFSGDLFCEYTAMLVQQSLTWPDY